MNTNEIFERTIGLALGTAIGDAKGIAYETLTREQIRIKIENENNTSLYTPVTNHPYIPENWAIGRWTDDTQLTLAMMRALTKSLLAKSNEDFMLNIVNEHIIEWKESIAGWGGTKNAIERLANGTHTYLNSGNKAEGNGVIMKLAPLALYYSLAGNVNDNQIETICRMTHDSPVALSTACIYVHMCIYLFERKSRNSKDFLQYLYELSLQYETKYQLTEEKHLVSLRIKRYLDANSPIDENLIIDVSSGGTYYCVDSLTMVIGLLACLPTCEPNFNTLIYASEIGGDTDSNAAIIGAIIGGMKGLTSLDQEHINQVYQTDYVRKIGEEFGQALIEYLREKAN
jgi:ADP-ribosylglycohydrolase